MTRVVGGGGGGGWCHDPGPQPTPTPAPRPQPSNSPTRPQLPQPQPPPTSTPRPQPSTPFHTFRVKSSSRQVVLALSRSRQVCSHQIVRVKLFCYDQQMPWSFNDYLFIILSILVNHSFKLGYFPNCLKIAKIIPLYKSVEKFLPTNYRPMSILTCLSKILEKLIHSRLTNIIDKHSVISSTQYRFRKHHLTSHAIADFVTLTYDNISNN